MCLHLIDEVFCTCAVTVVLAIDRASVSSVPSTSTSPDISNSVAIILSLNVAAPETLPSIVKNVVSAPPSVPLNIMSVSLAAASIVILPDDVVMFTAELPVDMLSA